MRTVGAGFTGAFRALDLLVAAPMLLVPVGARASRAALASAIVTGICGAIAFDVARALVASAPAALNRLGLRSKSEVSPRLLSAVSAVAVLTALLSPAWQAEASAPGGAVLGALLVLLAVRLGTSATETESPGGLTSSALVLGLAASYEPLVFFGALAAVAPRAVELARRARRTELDRRVALHAGCAFAVGLLPLALGAALVRRSPEIALSEPMFSLLARGTVVSPTAFARSEIGSTMLVVCAGGAALSLLVAEARRIALPLLLVVVVALGAITLQVPAGPNRFSPVILAGLACAYALGATMLGAAVIAIARARVPFAEASAALVVVLELVLPVRAIDETTTRREARAPNASAVWNDVAWGDAPPASVLLVADRGTMRRVASARASGHMRGDLLVVPAFDVLGRAGQRTLLREPKLAPLYRDIALGIAPEELSLAGLGAERSLLATFDPKWDRALSRHLVPTGLTSRFETEPRGPTERKKSFDAFLPSKERLVRVTVVKKDPELAAATAVLLRARAIGMAATGDRDLLSRALDDLRAFAPDDPTGAALVRRIVTTKGAIDVQDLAP
ncbi:MAG TPA: hypothetical protein VM925_25550 [Labilithrix sp.]|nr:hypothetical protein [Labilithrix sp.]